MKASTASFDEALNDTMPDEVQFRFDFDADVPWDGSIVFCAKRLTAEAWRSIRVGIPDRLRRLHHNIEACVP